MTELKPIETRRCGVDGCARPYLCKGYCRLHWERQHNTGTTADPEGPRGPKNPSWKGEGATYSSVHARMCRTPRPAACETCGRKGVRFEWALRGEVDRSTCLRSPEGYAYSTNPADYANLCKPCHNALDLSRDECRRGHPLAGDNLYIQPSNGKKFCRECQRQRRAARWRREKAARFEHGEGMAVAS